MGNILERVKDKAFLSFTFGGKAIEEFGFAVVSSENRYVTDFQPTFSNTLTNVPGRRGSLYWGTDISGLVLAFNLATDCATSRQVSNLKAQFAPGQYEKLILAEKPYCYAWALVNSTTSFSFLPFATTTVINGVEYEDTVYKGTATIEFIVPDGYFYDTGDNVYGDNISSQPWFLDSGLPLKNMITQTNCYLSNNIVANAGEAAKTVYAYNAGNAPAQANVCFTQHMSFTSESMVPWKDITIDNITIIKPRIFTDIDYTIAQLQTHSVSWDSDKTEVLIDLRDNLDSGLRAELIGIVNATGSGLYWESPTDTIAAIREIINEQDFQYSVNGIEVQSVLMATLPTHTFSAEIQETTTQIAENIGDSTNGQYLIISASEGIQPDGTIDVQAIQCSQALENLKVYFVNTYAI